MRFSVDTYRLARTNTWIPCRFRRGGATHGDRLRHVPRPALSNVVQPRHRSAGTGYPTGQSLAKQQLAIVLVFATLIVIAGIWSIAARVITPDRMAFGLLIATVTVALGLFAVMLTSPRVTPDERSRVLGFIPLFVASTMYWALQSQTYGVLAVYSEQRLDRTLGSFEFPAAWASRSTPSTFWSSLCLSQAYSPFERCPAAIASWVAVS